MDPLIVDHTPQGSPLLAYGTARGFWQHRLLLTFAGLGLLALGVGTVLFLQTSVPLPPHRLIVATVAPRAIQTQLDAELMRDLPAPWRIALEGRSLFPALLGVSLDEEGRPHAFALAVRSLRLWRLPTGVHAEGAGPFLLLTDDTGVSKEDLTVSSAFADTWEQRGHQAAFRIRADLLAFLAEETGTFGPEELFGTWDGMRGRLILTPRKTLPEAESRSAAPIFAFLGDHADDATAAVNGLLSQGIDLRALSVAPQSIALDTAASHTVALAWNETLQPSDAGILASLRGAGTLRLSDLSDQSPLVELLPGTHTFASDGATFLLIGENSASSTLLSPDSVPSFDPDCGQTVQFSLQGEAFHTLLDTWSVPASWKTKLNHFQIAESADGVHLCVK